jgi:hypothetical protein
VFPDVLGCLGFDLVPANIAATVIDLDIDLAKVAQDSQNVELYFLEFPCHADGLTASDINVVAAFAFFIEQRTEVAEFAEGQGASGLSWSEPQARPALSR